MVHWILDRSIQNRTFITLLALGLAGWGYLALVRTPIDAIPDLSDNQVIVFTEWPGHSPEEVEDQVTFPLTTRLQGLAGVRVVRSQSAFGFSMIYAIFEDDIDIYFARSRVLERLNLVTSALPEGVVPTLGPDATGVGHVFWYTVESDSLSLRDLRTLQDWFIRYQLSAVPGVAEVASVGGHVRQYEVLVDPQKLRAYALSLTEVVTAVQQANLNVGANAIESGGSWTIVRGVGLVQSTADLEAVAIGASAGTPVYVRDIASVQVGNAFRIASLVKGEHEAVGGVVVARVGTNTKTVIDGVKARIEQISSGLPPGVRIVPFYDRSELIEKAVGTLRRALLEEIALVTLAHIIFLMHLPSILIITIPLPLAVLTAFIFMYHLGVSSNIMSLAGIAIAIGVLVDAGIVVTENAFRTVERKGIDTSNRRAVRAAVHEATAAIARPVFFSMAIIVLAFVPVFALTGQEGKLFRPLAFTKTFAVIASTIFALTLVPVLSTLLIRGRVHAEESNRVMRWLQRLYAPALRAGLAHPRIAVTTAGLLLVGALVLATRIGTEFMPPLNEGDLMFMPITDPSVSLEQNTEIARRQNAAIQSFPEVAWVVAKVSRADTATDAAPLNMTETIVHLKSQAEWRPGVTIESLRAEMSRAVQLPGVTNIWTMPIVNRIDMLTTGVRSELGIKIYGADLATLERSARQIGDLLRQVPGAANVYPDQTTGAQYLDIRVDREAAARYGLQVAAVQDMVRTAVGETPLFLAIEGRQRVPVVVRFAARDRADVRAIENVLVTAPSGAQVALADVATIQPRRGPSMIASENGLLVSTVLLNVEGRDVGGFVRDASRVLADRLSLPAGYYFAWSGRFENEQSARQRLMIVIPLVLFVIFVLLFFVYHSWIEAAHVLLAVPFALTGGLYLLWALGYNFSVAVWVGFIALFGTAVQTGVVMVIYLEEAVRRARAADASPWTRARLRQAVIDGALLRLRPKVMTVATVVASLLPIMWSTSPGSEVMKPLATPVLGGMISSLLHVLIVTPVIFFALHARGLPLGTEPVVTSEDLAAHLDKRRRWAPVFAVLLLVTVSGGAVGGWLMLGSRSEPAAPVQPPLATTQRGDVSVVLTAVDGNVRLGRGDIIVEFRRAGGTLVDVGTLRAGATMAMPGMAMTAGLSVQRVDAGRYRISGDYAMAGAWRFTLEWDGPPPDQATVEIGVQ